jgi:hypothetical protein
LGGDILHAKKFRRMVPTTHGKPMVLSFLEADLQRLAPPKPGGRKASKKPAHSNGQAEPTPPAPKPVPEGLQRIMPRWDEEKRELPYGDKLCKRYDANPAKNQIDVIEAFQAANWPRTIPDPFRNSRRLNMTIASLNRSMATGTIKFRWDGTGEGVNWEPQ